MVEFHYEPMFQLESDQTDYEKISDKGVKVVKAFGQDYLQVDAQVIETLTARAFSDVSHLLRPKHLESLSQILKDPEASQNDRYVAKELLRNAVIAAEGVFPSCQDTGTAIVYAEKGDRVVTNGDDAKEMSKGIFDT